jgi:hypothetical protein
MHKGGGGVSTYGGYVVIAAFLAGGFKSTLVSAQGKGGGSHDKKLDCGGNI